MTEDWLTLDFAEKMSLAYFIKSFKRLEKVSLKNKKKINSETENILL